MKENTYFKKAVKTPSERERDLRQSWLQLEGTAFGTAQVAFWGLVLAKVGFSPLLICSTCIFEIKANITNTPKVSCALFHSRTLNLVVGASGTPHHSESKAHAHNSVWVGWQRSDEAEFPLHKCTCPFKKLGPFPFVWGHQERTLCMCATFQE